MSVSSMSFWTSLVRKQLNYLQLKYFLKTIEKQYDTDNKKKKHSYLQ